jgi:hypothetical protein
MMFQKRPPFRSESWRRAVVSLPCISCGIEGMSQAAHPNHRGKGMGTKAPDCWCVPLCPDCHRLFDQGCQYTKAERRDTMDGWIIATVLRLAEEGLVKA